MPVGIRAGAHGMVGIGLMAVGTRSNSNTNEPLPQDPKRMTEFVTNIVNAALERGEDVRGWLFKCEQFFKADNIVDNCKEYIDDFNRLMCRIDLVEFQRISFFLAGLGSEIELAVSMLKPTTLAKLEKEVLETEEIIEYTTHISLNAINGTNTYQAIRAYGHVGKHKLHILIDYGSTHNFLDLNIAKKLGCQLTSTCPFQVEIAGGHQLVSKYMCKNFRWKLYGDELSSDVMIILWVAVKWIELSSMVLYVYPTTTLCMLKAEGTKEVPAEISKLISQYHDVFAVPTTLPPMRPYDHKIPLKEGIIPITLRPYRHPPTQKHAIEVMVKELLDTGVIRDSHGPFYSPMVMVKKKDGTWRTCIDYRKLNNATIKDMFPIPIIEELIDELQGHYEFLVMPFGLTNAPSTFQALMNSVFKEYLRRFVLVFFDDILVYSPTMETHVQHLRIVLEALRQNTPYAKQSKCVFRTEKVEYLGHVITKGGVATDDNNSYNTFIKIQVEDIQECKQQLKGSLINKPDLAAYPGLLQPLPILKKVWTEIYMDFIEGLPSSYGKTTIFIVVDRLSQCLLDAIDRTLATKEAMIQLLQIHMERAQNKMKTIADAKRTDIEFEVGQWVYLKLQPHRQVTVRLGKYN
nr:hypothetical protein [Tanacetum cinerariifolium]